MAIINLGLKKGLAANIDYNKRYNAYLADEQLAQQEERLTMERVKLMQQMFDPYDGELTPAGNAKYNKHIENISIEMGKLMNQSGGNIFSDPETAQKAMELSRKVKVNPILQEEQIYRSELAKFYTNIEKYPHLAGSPMAENFLNQVETWAASEDRGPIPEWKVDMSPSIPDYINENYTNLYAPQYNANSKSWELVLDKTNFDIAHQDFKSQASPVFMQLASAFKNANPQYKDLTESEFINSKEWDEYTKNQLVLRAQINSRINEWVRSQNLSSQSKANEPIIRTALDIPSYNLFVNGKKVSGVNIPEIYGTRMPNEKESIAEQSLRLAMKADGRYPIPAALNQHQIFIYGDGSMQINGDDNIKSNIEGAAYIKSDAFTELNNAKIVASKNNDQVKVREIQNFQDQLKSTPITESNRQQFGFDLSGINTTIYTFDYNATLKTNTQKLAKSFVGQAITSKSKMADQDSNRLEREIINTLSTNPQDKVVAPTEVPAKKNDPNNVSITPPN